MGDYSLKYNGRVNISQPDSNILFTMKDKNDVRSTSYTDAMNGNWYKTKLSNAFFSSKNIKIIQNGIRYGVYLKSNSQYVIDEQCEDELKVIMRAIFLQNSKNLPNNIKQQIYFLNKFVLDFCIKDVYGEASSYMKYKKDASTMYNPISYPVMTKINDKQLELKKWF